MNFIDASGVLADSAQLLNDDKMAHDARSVVQSIVDAYDALAPDWTLAPDWAQWATIFDNGKFCWWEFPPVPNLVDGQWVVMESTHTKIGRVKTQMKMPLPFGVDWRLCIWQRPEAQVLDTSCPVCGMEH